MYLMNYFRFLLVSSLSLAAQLPSLGTLFFKFLFRSLPYCTGMSGGLLFVCGAWVGVVFKALRN